MKKAFYLTICIVGALVLAASCNKAVTPESTVITAVADQISSVTKVEMAYCYEALWQAGDQICVNQGTTSDTFTLVRGEGSTKGTFEGTKSITGEIEAFYPVSVGETMTWPATQTNNQAVPMYAHQTITGAEGETVSFSSLGAVLQIVFNTTIPNIVLKSIELRDGAKPLSGEFTVDSDGKAVIKEGGAAAITLNLGEDGMILGKGANYFYVSVPAGKYEDLTLTFTGDDDGTFVMTGGNLDIQRNTVGRLTLTGSKYHFAILPGEFTVSAGPDGEEGTADDVKVRFSPGNLRYDVENGILGFFQNQYDCGPETYEQGHDKEISLFTWGYGSWSTVPNTTEYLTGVMQGADFSHAQDWGSRLGDGSVWRTLTYEETAFLLKNKNRVGRAIVCGMNGDIVLPDTFTDPETNRGSSAFVPMTESSVSNSYEDNIYSMGSDWDAMEAAGAVFFPAAGYREGMTIHNYGAMGNFWTCTSSNLDNAGRAFRAHMNSSRSASAVLGDKNWGIPVRLVTNCTQ